MIRDRRGHRASKEPTNPDPDHPKRKAPSYERHLQSAGSIYHAQLLSSQDNILVCRLFFRLWSPEKIGMSQVEISATSTVKVVPTTIGALTNQPHD